MQNRGAYGGPFARTLDRKSPESPPFLNSSHTRPLSRAPSAATPCQAFPTAHSQLSLEPPPSAVTVANSSLPASYPTPPVTLIVSSVHLTDFSTPPATTSTAQGGSLTAENVPWTTVVWFPPVSAGMTAAIVAATVVPVALILTSALLLLRFLRQREITESRELGVTPRSPSAIRSGRWAGYERVSHTIATRSYGLSVQPPTAEATAICEQRPNSTHSISLRNVPQGAYEPHFGDTSFLLDGSHRSDSSDGLGSHDDNGSMGEIEYGREPSASERLAGRQASYYIPFSVLSLGSAEQAFAELNERFGLLV